jgi:hypothetical protein
MRACNSAPDGLFRTKVAFMHNKINGLAVEVKHGSGRPRIVGRARRADRSTGAARNCDIQRPRSSCHVDEAADARDNA